MSNNNCGCPANSPSQLACPPRLQVPVDQFVCEETNNPSGPSGLPLTFHPALSSFIVPNVGQQSALLVADGSIFSPGQWVQFLNPSGVFRIISITGNTLQLSNAAADGVTPIQGNPSPPYQYPINAAFTVVGDPRQLTNGEFASNVQAAIEALQSICVNNIPNKNANEEVYLLGYIKSTLCEGEDGACLRKQSFAYIDRDGVFHFDGPIVADAFNVPVPDGGIPSNNGTNLNPNNGTGGGFLLPFYNPNTGLVSYIDLFSGITNGGAYSFSLSPTGQISLVSGGAQKYYWPDKEVHNGNTSPYNGYAQADVDIATVIAESVPSWAKSVVVRVHGNLDTNNSSAGIRVNLNGTTAVWTTTSGERRAAYDQQFVIPITNGKFNLEIIAYDNNTGTTVGPFNWNNGGGSLNGFVRISIIGLVG